MKKIFLLACIGLSLFSCGQTSPVKNAASSSIPAELITADSVFWAITTVSTINYVNTTPGSSYNTYQNGGGMIANFKFLKNNRFIFRLYLQANSYNISTETWTDVEGTVEFTKNAKGQAIFITKAEKGIYRINKNGSHSSRPITSTELKTQHSNTYLWEKTTFPDDPQNVYLLVVDLDQHPGANPDDPKTIEPGWVSKFHIPASH